MQTQACVCVVYRYIVNVNTWFVLLIIFIKFCIKNCFIFVYLPMWDKGSMMVETMSVLFTVFHTEPSIMHG